MPKKFFPVITIILLTVTNVFAAADPIDTTISKHFSKYKNKEYFSGMAVAVYKPGQPIKNYVQGQVSHDADSAKVTTDTLFQIGSITKSFTTAIMLQLQKEQKLQLTDTLQQYLPEYAKWSKLSLTSLFNMTSGLPNYSNSATMNMAFVKDPEHVWTSRELIAISYPPKDFAPPLKTGYEYTNTGYILATLIIENLTQHSFNVEIEERAIKRAGLQNTFYPVPVTTAAINARLAHGYGYNPYDNPELVGKDIYHTNLSWAAAAGGAVANAEDIIKWVKALFIDETILDAAQKKQLEALVSNTTGKPINTTSKDEPRGFALGVAEMYKEGIGRFWFYEGETIGFRAVYMYVPKTGIIISCLVNSAVNSENDHTGELLQNLYMLVSQNK